VHLSEVIVNLSQLKDVLEPLRKFAQDEFSFEVEGLQVTLRPLLPWEEIRCQQRAAEVLKNVQAEDGMDDDDPLTRAASLQYFDQFRSEVASYALVQIGDQDLREVLEIETGETLPNGTPVKVPLQRALRDLINSSWSRAMITICFAKYGDMITKISEKADRIAKDSLSDLDTEIERTINRLERLRKEREQRAKGDPSVTTQQIQALMRAGDALDREIDDAIQSVRDDQDLRADTERADLELAQQLRESVEPPQPPVITPPPPRQPVLPPKAPPPTVQPPVPAQDPQFRSSFEELESEDSQAIEIDRIAAAQKAAALAARQQLQGQDLGGSPSRVMSDAGQEIEAVRLPSQTLSPRGQNPAPDPKKAKVDPKADTGSRNPKFKPPGG